MELIVQLASVSLLFIGTFTVTIVSKKASMGFIAGLPLFLIYFPLSLYFYTAPIVIVGQLVAGPFLGLLVNKYLHRSTEPVPPRPVSQRLWQVFKYIFVLALVIIASHFLAYPVGHWLDEKYHLGAGSWISVGPFSGYLDGLILSYTFLAPIGLALFSGRWYNGIYFVLLIVLFAISDLGNPAAKYFLLFPMAGFGIAYLLLILIKKSKPSF